MGVSIIEDQADEEVLRYISIILLHNEGMKGDYLCYCQICMQEHEGS